MHDCDIAVLVGMAVDFDAPDIFAHRRCRGKSQGVVRVRNGYQQVSEVCGPVVEVKAAAVGA